MNFKDNPPIIGHLVELRKRLLNCLITVFCIFLSLIYFTNDIYSFIASPLINHMPRGGRMIATDVTSPFFIPIKLTFIISIIFAMPFIIYQIWTFIAPALYLHERRLILPIMLLSMMLFYIGIIFAYFIVLPLAFRFFTTTVPKGITIATDISNYLDFVMSIFMVFGLIFEVPIVVFLLCCFNITTPKDLKEKRPYIFTGSFILGMLLTPPDVFSQIFLAIPMYFLFEVGLYLSEYYFNNFRKSLDK